MKARGGGGRSPESTLSDTESPPGKPLYEIGRVEADREAYNPQPLPLPASRSFGGLITLAEFSPSGPTDPSPLLGHGSGGSELDKQGGGGRHRVAERTTLRPRRISLPKRQSRQAADLEQD